MFYFIPRQNFFKWVFKYVFDSKLSHSGHFVFTVLCLFASFKLFSSKFNFLFACVQFESLQTTGDWTLPTMLFLARGPVPLLLHSLSGGTGPTLQHFGFWRDWSLLILDPTLEGPVPLVLASCNRGTHPKMTGRSRFLFPLSVPGGGWWWENMESRLT